MNRWINRYYGSQLSYKHGDKVQFTKIVIDRFIYRYYINRWIDRYCEK